MNLDEIAVGRVLIIGIGNRERGDDGIGPVLIDKLSSAGFTNILDVGTVPENYTKLIIQYCPDTIILVDAISFGSKPGNWKIFNPEECNGYGFSTHNASLNIFTFYIRQHIPVKVFLLGIQPAATEFRTGLSPELKQSVNQLVDKLKVFYDIRSLEINQT